MARAQISAGAGRLICGRVEEEEEEGRRKEVRLGVREKGQKGKKKESKKGVRSGEGVEEGFKGEERRGTAGDTKQDRSFHSFSSYL